MTIVPPQKIMLVLTGAPQRGTSNDYCPSTKNCCGYSQEHLTETLLMIIVPPQKTVVGIHRSTSQRHF